MVNQYGYIASKNGDVNIIKLNGDILLTHREELNRFGTYVVNGIANGGKGILYHKGKPLVKSDIIGTLKSNKYSGVELDTTYNKVINITLADYNTLLSGKLVSGYKHFSLDDVYNIVDNPAIVETIPYVKTGNKFVFTVGNDTIEWPHTKGVVFNNVIGLNIENDEDTSINGIAHRDWPYFDIRYFNPIVNVGDTISLELRVDDELDSLKLYDTLGETFTTIIKIEGDDNRKVVKTTYAGTITIETPSFTEAGQTWFTVQTIDSRGVSSMVQYLDVLVKDDTEDDIWEVEDSDLSDYGITTVADDEPLFDTEPNVLNTPFEYDLTKSYKNKVGFSALFAYAKTQGYTGVKLPKHTYSICYNDKIGGTDANPEFGIQIYFVVTLSQKGSGTNAYSYISEVKEITSDSSLAESTDYIVTENGETPLDFVKRDGANLFIYGSTYGDIAGQHIIIGDPNWKTLSANAQKAIKDVYNYLRTFDRGDVRTKVRTSSTVTSADAIKINNKSLPAKQYYFVYNTAVYGNEIKFPDNFTIDLNGSTFKASGNLDAFKGYLFRMYDNVNTHIINTAEEKAIIDGGYSYYDFFGAMFKQARSAVGEGLSCINMASSKFCSFENIEVCGAIGYDGTYDKITFPNASINGSDTAFYSNMFVNSRGETESCTDDLVVSGLYTINNNNVKCDLLSVFKQGYGGYKNCGTTPNIILSFYRDNYSSSFIASIKTKMYHGIKVPIGARYVKLTGYGEAAANEDEADAKEALWFRHSIGPRFKIESTNVGNTIKDCYWHDTRTVAICNPIGKQILYDNILYRRIVNSDLLRQGSGGTVTPLLGDFEDCWENAKYITIRNCELDRSNNDDVTSAMLVIYACEFFDFINNYNISLSFGTKTHNVESALIKGSAIPFIQIYKNRAAFNPHLEFTGNTFGVFAISTDYLNYDVVANGYNRQIERRITVDNSTIVRLCNYNGLKLRDSKMDVLNIDYQPISDIYSK